MIKIGDLVRNRRVPSFGIGLVISVGCESDYVIVVFPVFGQQVIYADDMEIVNESR